MNAKLASIHWCFVYLIGIVSPGFTQPTLPHPQAHAHNDYQHTKPLLGALQHGFTSVEVDVHVVDSVLLVSHEKPSPGAKTLRQLYLAPLDSLLTRNGGRIYSGYENPFYLMIDCKTEAASTYRAIQQALNQYPKLQCTRARCPVIILISGNRAIDQVMKGSYQGIALDGRPADLEKGISSQRMPIVSDAFSNWSTWNGKSTPQAGDMELIRALAERVHTEGKKLRLWAIPDNELAWSALLEAGVDFINTDRPQALHEFLLKKGL